MPHAATVFAVVENHGSTPDALVGAESPVAAGATLSQTYPAVPSASPAGAAGTPAFAMREVNRIDVPASSSLELKPTGFHVMLMDLGDELPDGTIQVTLVFERAGPVTVEAQVRKTPAASPSAAG